MPALPRLLRACSPPGANRLAGGPVRVTAEIGRRFEGSDVSCVAIVDSIARGLTHCVESCIVARFVSLASLDQAQSLAQDFACMFMAPGGRQNVDQVCLVIGGDDISRRHGRHDVRDDLGISSQRALGSRAVQPPSHAPAPFRPRAWSTAVKQPPRRAARGREACGRKATALGGAGRGAFESTICRIRYER